MMFISAGDIVAIGMVTVDTPTIIHNMRQSSYNDDGDDDDRTLAKPGPNHHKWKEAQWGLTAK